MWTFLTETTERLMVWKSTKIKVRHISENTLPWIKQWLIGVHYFQLNVGIQMCNLLLAGEEPQIMGLPSDTAWTKSPFLNLLTSGMPMGSWLWCFNPQIQNRWPKVTSVSTQIAFCRLATKRRSQELFVKGVTSGICFWTQERRKTNNKKSAVLLFQCFPPDMFK